MMYFYVHRPYAGTTNTRFDNSRFGKRRGKTPLFTSTTCNKYGDLNKTSVPLTDFSSGFPITNYTLRRRRKKSDTLDKSSDNLFTFSGIGILSDQRVSKWRRILWFLLFSMCAGLCTYYVSDRLRLYFSNPVLVAVTVIRNQTISFPSVTFCRDVTTGWLYMIHVLAYWMKQSCPKNLPCFDDLHAKEVVHYNLSLINTTFVDLWQFNDVDESSLTAVIPCETMHNRTHCPPNMAKMMKMQRVYTLYGACVVLSADGLLEYRGPKTYVDIKIKQHNKIDKISKDGGTFYLQNEGIINPHDAAMLLEAIPRGQEINGRLTIKQFEFLNRSEELCAEEEESTECYKKCIDKLIEEQISCWIPVYEPTKPKPPCPNLYEGSVQVRTVQKIYSNLSLSSCAGCLHKCRETIYSVTTDAFRETEDNSTTLRLYYADNLIEIVKEVYSYSFPALLSDVGGTLGFLLGICLINVLQILEGFILKIVIVVHQHFVPDKRGVMKK